ncbi:hexitol phosphatase HxpB [Arundinibacter roseus]|uniref:Hexitol phosphatase HxpB n=1 Tax=Arundinibacter roseus TaxID=2070510 RepID=A0A4R4KII8_9BACT|nr:hexitol phosphatase HxpB [Arundinibacter roseus]TDB68004.1 hexitol phosphatase HxpB [Arundinibacter roseus]
MIEAVLFDMDGLLVDSEPIWQQVALDVFATVNVPLTVEICQEATGLGTSQFVQYIYDRMPWTGKTQLQIGEEILALAHVRIAHDAQEMPGAPETVRFFADQNIPLAIASASPMNIIESVLDRLELKPYFKLWHSALLEARNKPYPDVYLGAARRLGANPARCLAFEDSGNGLKSAVAAGMLTVAVPAAYELSDPKFDVATIKIPSLRYFDQNIFNTLLQKFR